MSLRLLMAAGAYPPIPVVDRVQGLRGEVRGEANAHVPAPPLLDCGLPQRLYGYAPLSPGRGCARRAARRIDGHLKTSL